MNKKGLTLVELIATLIILSIVALIVTPNILVSIKQYKQQLYDTNLSTIKNSSTGWLSDYLSNRTSSQYFPELLADYSNKTEIESEGLVVPISELINGGYLKEGIKDTINNGTFDDSAHSVFVLITCRLMGNSAKGDLECDYNSDVYISINDYIEKSAEKYAEDNKVIQNTNYTIQTLMDNNYIKESLKKISGETYSNITSTNNILVTVTEKEVNGITKYEYEAKIVS